MKYKITAIICAAAVLVSSVSVAIAAGVEDTDTLDSTDSVSTVSEQDPPTPQSDGDVEESTTAIHGVTTDGEEDPEESTTAIHEATTSEESSDPSESSESSTEPEKEPEPEMSVQEIIYKYLTEELELCSAAAAGIMGNVMIECGFDPTLEVIDTNDKPSFGLMMWNGPRYEALKKWCAEHGFEKTDPRGQLGYLKMELETTEKRSYASMKNIPDTAEGAVLAAILWADEFERCTKTSYGLRVYYALNNYWQEYACGGLGESEGIYGYYYNVPVNIKEGEPLTFYGAVVSYTSPLKSITAGVYSEDGKLITGRTMTATNHVGNIGVIDRFIVMNKLPKGKYYYTITAKNDTDEYVVERRLFTVSGEPTKSLLVYETEGGGLCEMGAHCPSFRFNDMTPITHWAHGDIDFVLDNGFFLGNGAGYFLPETNMSRSMFVTVLHRLSDKYGLITEPEDAADSASDSESTADEPVTDTGSAASDAEGTVGDTISPETDNKGTEPDEINTDTSSNETETTGNGSDGDSDEPAGSDSGGSADEPVEYPFGDVIYDSWYGPHVLWAHKYELVRGKSEGIFDPDGEISRGELAVLMYRAYEKSGFDVSARADLADFADGDTVPDWASEEMSWAVATGLINGTVTGGTTKLSTMELATREQVSAIIRRFATLVENSEKIPTTPEATPDVTPAETPVESVADTTADTTPTGTTEE